MGVVTTVASAASTLGLPLAGVTLAGVTPAVLGVRPGSAARRGGAVEEGPQAPLEPLI